VKRELDQSKRTELAKRLSASGDDFVVGVLEVAVLLNTTPGYIYQAISPARLSRGGISLHLPPTLNIGGRKKLWRLGDIFALLRSAAPVVRPTDLGDRSANKGGSHLEAPSAGRSSRLGRPRRG